MLNKDQLIYLIICKRIKTSGSFFSLLSISTRTSIAYCDQEKTTRRPLINKSTRKIEAAIVSGIVEIDFHKG
jgi:hypothetical protein